MYIKYLTFYTLKVVPLTRGAIDSRSKVNLNEVIIKGDQIEDLCTLSLLHGVVAWPVVCDCGISWSRDRY